MRNKETIKYQSMYPMLRLVLRVRRNAYVVLKNISSALLASRKPSAVVPSCYRACNTSTVDGDIKLKILFGKLPNNLLGNVYLCQCLGSPGAYMVGDTNLVKICFSKGEATLMNRRMWNPSAILKMALHATKHRFEHFGVMQMSPGLGMASYAEGLYMLPDGRLGVTSDVDRPWIVSRHNLRVQSPLGTRKEWMPMMQGKEGEVMGSLFAGYNNSHALYTDTNTKEVFLVNYRCKQADAAHPCKLMKWNGAEKFQTWLVKGEDGRNICIKQSIHELVFTKDYIILADTAFATGSEILDQWKNAPMPSVKTALYIVDRHQLVKDNKTVVAKRVDIEMPCIHLLAEYENPIDIITLYMLHTPATNTAEVIRSYDRDIAGNRFAKNLVGYGTLPVLDVSAVGKHCICMRTKAVIHTKYIQDKQYTWGPYMYSYMGRQTRPFNEQELFVMFKGFHVELLPKRIIKAYKDVQNRKVPMAEILKKGGIEAGNCIARIQKEDFKTVDRYTFSKKELLYTIACLETNETKGDYLLAAVVSDKPASHDSSGHEYWIFEANNLHKGPICKLGHQKLDNTILFHALYLTHKQEKSLPEKDVKYHIPLDKDYPSEELLKWDVTVKKTFEDVVWPYFGADETGRKKAERNIRQMLRQISAKR